MSLETKSSLSFLFIYMEPSMKNHLTYIVAVCDEMISLLKDEPICQIFRHKHSLMTSRKVGWWFCILTLGGGNLVAPCSGYFSRKFKCCVGDDQTFLQKNVIFLKFRPSQVHIIVDRWRNTQDKKPMVRNYRSCNFVDSLRLVATVTLFEPQGSELADLALLWHIIIMRRGW